MLYIAGIIQRHKIVWVGRSLWEPQSCIRNEFQMLQFWNSSNTAQVVECLVKMIMHLIW